MVILPELLNKKIIDWFDLKRPLIAFKFQTVSLVVMLFVHKVFDLISRYDRY